MNEITRINLTVILLASWTNRTKTAEYWKWEIELYFLNFDGIIGILVLTWKAHWADVTDVDELSMAETRRSEIHCCSLREIQLRPRFSIGKKYPLNPKNPTWKMYRFSKKEQTWEIVGTHKKVLQQALVLRNLQVNAPRDVARLNAIKMYRVFLSHSIYTHVICMIISIEPAALIQNRFQEYTHRSKHSENIVETIAEMMLH